MSELSELLSRLVAINSINPDLVPGGNGESEIAAFVAAWCTERGLEVHTEHAADGRPNVIAVARGSGGGASLMLNAHMDTVGVAGMSEPFTPHFRDGKLYGRGAYDMKASLAASMLAVARAKALNLRGDVLLTAVADEEYASIGTRKLLEAWKADACVITEPTEMEIVIAHKGFAWFDIETVGVAAHGSRPELGVDAITHMGYVLVELDRLNQRLMATGKHKLLGTGSLHASLIAGGQELSSYPAHCRLQVERRTLPAEKLAQVEEQIAQIMRTLSATVPHFNASSKLTLTQAAFEIERDAPLVKQLKKALTGELGSEPVIAGRPFWMDAALTSAAGIPTVVLGPTGAGAHAVEEWVDVQSAAQCAAVYTALASSWCG